ncbi:MAG: hypothetical protein ACKO5R_13865 [Planctomycetaceae bacterium]
MDGEHDAAGSAGGRVSRAGGEGGASGGDGCDAQRPACPVCGGRLIEIRAKFQCQQCHRICETCCEGGRG